MSQDQAQFSMNIHSRRSDKRKNCGFKNIRIRLDGQIQFEHGYVWTWKFLNPERKSCSLGARDLSSAVSGFCQVFIVSFAARGFGLGPKICLPSANTENSRCTREKPLVPRVKKLRIQKHPDTCGRRGLSLTLPQRPPRRLAWQYLNLNGRLTGVGHIKLCTDPFFPTARFQVLLMPHVIPFELVGIIGIHHVPKIQVGVYDPVVKLNINPIAVDDVVKWNGKHDSKRFLDAWDVVCEYSFCAICNGPRSFSCAVSQRST